MHSSFAYAFNVDEAVVDSRLRKERLRTVADDSSDDEEEAAPTWAQYMAHTATLICPHAREEVLTQYEIDLGLGTPVQVKTFDELLLTEYKWFDKMKQQNTKRDENGPRTLSEKAFASFGFSIALAIMQQIFANNPDFLVCLLKVPLRATFVEPNDVAALFKFKGHTMIDTEELSQLFKMLRRDLDGSMPMPQYRALLAKQRLEKVRAKDPHGELHVRGHYIGLSAMHEPFPLKGRRPNESANAKPERSRPLVTRQPNPKRRKPAPVPKSPGLGMI